MTELTYNLLHHEYHSIIEILSRLDKQLVIVDKPRIGLKLHARGLIIQLENACLSSSLPAAEKRALQAYATRVKRFCSRYFEEGPSPNMPMLFMLRLPCDSHELMSAHENLHQEYLDLRTNLRLSMRNLKSMYRVTRELNRI